MKILVTGGCGYIGSATARFLRRAGHAVWVLDDLSEGHEGAWDGKKEKLDLLDREAVRNFLAGTSWDGVIHFAARCYVGESVEQPVRYWRHNLVPLIHLCESLDGVPVVFSSSCAVYGVPEGDRLDEAHPLRPVNPYGATKAAGERLLADRAAAGRGNYAALRYFNAAGAEPDGNHGEDHRPETHLLPRAIRAALGEGEPLTLFGSDWDTPDGTCVRDYIHVLDLASAHLAALERLAGGEASGSWNLGTGRGVSVREVIEALGTLLGRPVPFQNGDRRAGDPPALVADPSRARLELGWTATWTEFPALLETAVRWHRNNPRGYSQ